MIPCKIELSQAQKAKAKKGLNVQVRASQIGKGDTYHFSDTNIKKLVNALKSGKACRIKFDEDEIVGAGWGKKIGKAFKSTKKALKENHVGRKVTNTLAKVNKKLDQYAPLVEGTPFAPVYGAVQAGVKGAQTGASNVIGLTKTAEKLSQMKKGDFKSGLKQMAMNGAKQVVASQVESMPQLKAGLQMAKDVSRIAGGSIGRPKTYSDQVAMLRQDQSAFNPVKPAIIPKAIKSGGSFKANGVGSDHPRLIPYRGGSFKAGSFK
jgi:hypothetical protein